MKRTFFIKIIALSLAASLITNNVSGSAFRVPRSPRNLEHAIRNDFFAAEALAETGISPVQTPHPKAKLDAIYGTEALSAQTITLLAKGQEYSFRAHIRSSDLMKRIELYPLNPTHRLDDPDLFIYAFNTTQEGWGLHGMYIDPRLRDRGLSKPLISLFFEHFPDIRNVHRAYSHPLGRAVLMKDFGYRPESAEAPLFYLGPKERGGTILYFKNPTDLHTFRVWASGNVQGQYLDLRVEEPPSGVTPIPMNTRLVRGQPANQSRYSIFIPLIGAAMAAVGWLAFGPLHSVYADGLSPRSIAGGNAIMYYVLAFLGYAFNFIGAFALVSAIYIFSENQYLAQTEHSLKEWRKIMEDYEISLINDDKASPRNRLSFKDRRWEEKGYVNAAEKYNKAKSARWILFRWVFFGVSISATSVLMAVLGVGRSWLPSLFFGMFSILVHAFAFHILPTPQDVRTAKRKAIATFAAILVMEIGLIIGWTDTFHTFDLFEWLINGDSKQGMLQAPVLPKLSETAA